jgi:hypothetical protein
MGTFVYTLYLVLTVSRWGLMMEFCVYGNEPLASIKAGNFVITCETMIFSGMIMQHAVGLYILYVTVNWVF